MLHDAGLVGRIRALGTAFVDPHPASAPSIEYNFSTGLPAGWTFTRGGAANATNCLYTDGSTIANFFTYPINTPRFLHHGLLIEPAATNLFINSEGPSPGAQTITVALGYHSIWMHGAGSVTIAAGTAVGTNFGSATHGTPRIVNITTAGTIIVTVVGVATRVQVELNTSPTSYVRSTATAQTRTEERLVRTMSAGQIDGPESTHWLEWLPVTVGAQSPVVLLAAGTNTTTSSATCEQFIAHIDTTSFSGLSVWVNGTQRTSMIPVPIAIGVQRTAISTSLHRAQIASNGIRAGAADPNVRPAAFTELTVTGVGKPFNGFIRGYRYWPVALSDAELVYVTTPGVYPSPPILALDFSGTTLPRAMTYARSGAYTGVYTDHQWTDTWPAPVTEFASATVPRVSASGRGILLEPATTNYYPNSTVFPPGGGPVVVNCPVAGRYTLFAHFSGLGVVSSITATIDPADYSGGAFGQPLIGFSGGVGGTEPIQFTVLTPGTIEVYLLLAEEPIVCVNLELTPRRGWPPTSLVKTTTAGQTRATDYAQMKLGPWFPTGPRTYVVTFLLTTNAGAGYMVFSAGSTHNLHDRVCSAVRQIDTTGVVNPDNPMFIKGATHNLPDNISQMWHGDPNFTDPSHPINAPCTPNTLYRVAYTVTNGRRDLVVNGARTAITEAEGGPSMTLPSTGNLTIGNNPQLGLPAQPMYFRKIDIYDYEMTQDQMVALTI